MSIGQGRWLIWFLSGLVERVEYTYLDCESRCLEFTERASRVQGLRSWVLLGRIGALGIRWQRRFLSVYIISFDLRVIFD